MKDCFIYLLRRVKKKLSEKLFSTNEKHIVFTLWNKWKIKKNVILVVSTHEKKSYRKNGSDDLFLCTREKKFSTCLDTSQKKLNLE